MARGDAAAMVGTWMARALEQWPGLPAPRAVIYDGVVADVVAIADGADCWRRLPRVLMDRFEGEGWAWNGIYARASPETLELVAAAGPPVCVTLERVGGPGTSGMCWDAVLLQRTLWARDVKAWPGYVSCDGESGLGTVSGLVSPLRDRDGTVVAVWDLDCTGELGPFDAQFMDALLGSLAVSVPPDFETLRGG